MRPTEAVAATGLDPAWLPLAAGRLVLLRSPGREGDVASDLATLVGWSVDVLVSLTTAAEPHLGAIRRTVRGLPLAWHHLPIADFGTPDARWEAAWAKVAPQLHRRLDQGGTVAVHCWGGRGRSGLVAARLLQERGLPPAAAIRTVRRIRPDAIETPQQVAHLRRTGPSP